MSVETSTRKELPAALVTEAAAWVARLHGPFRTPAVENGFRDWLREDPDHARAFELVTESWDEVPALRDAADIRISLPSDRRKPGRWRIPLASAAALAVLSLLAGLYFLRSPKVSTQVGEQRVIALQDGSRIHLNTATELRVEYDEKRRHVSLQSGEALFVVAQEPTRPFIVSVGDREVKALGTSFLVRRDPQRVAVTLVEGKVAVAPRAAPSGTSDEKWRSARILTPGERVTFSEARNTPALDHPAIESLTAWQRGKVPIENLTLLDAAAEMNRYGTVALIIERREAQHLRVSGIFQAGDSLSFARAVAQNYGLEVEQRDGHIVLAGSPRQDLPRPAARP